MNIDTDTIINKQEFLDKVALEFMKTILSTNERFHDYIQEKDIMVAISKDAYDMANKMYEHRSKSKKE